MGVVAAFGLSTRSKGQAASRALPGLTLGPRKEENQHFGAFHSKCHSATKRGNAEETSQQHEQLCVPRGKSLAQGRLACSTEYPACQESHWCVEWWQDEFFSWNIEINSANTLVSWRASQCLGWWLEEARNWVPSGSAATSLPIFLQVSLS